MVNQDWDDLDDPANSLVDVNPDQEDFGQVNRNRLWSVLYVQAERGVAVFVMKDSSFHDKQPRC